MRPRRKKSVGRKIIPHWESAAHSLIWRDKAWKHFQHEALMQEAILEQFQKAGWPSFLEITRLGKELSRSKKHVHDTIRNLNRSLKGGIHFRLEGNGSRICWEPA